MRPRSISAAVAALLTILTVAGVSLTVGAGPAAAGPYESGQFFSVDISAAPDHVWENYPTTFNVAVTDKAGDSRKMKDISITSTSPGLTCTNTQFPNALNGATHTLVCTVPAQLAGTDYHASISIKANIVRTGLFQTVVKWNDSVTADKWIGWESKGIDVSIQPPNATGYMQGADVTLDLTATNTGTLPLQNVQLTGLPGANCSFFIGTLQPGESRMRTCTKHTGITEQSYQFTAQASGSIGTPVVPAQWSNVVTDTTDVWVTLWAPSMGVDVSLTDDQPAGWVIGDPMYTDISVTNTSNVTTDVAVATNGATCNNTLTLPAGGTYTYRCNVVNKTSDFTITANATATPTGLTGFGVPTAQDSASTNFHVLPFKVSIVDLRADPKVAATIPVRIDVQNRVWNAQAAQLDTGFSQCNQAVSVPGYQTTSVYCTVTMTSTFTMTAKVALGGWNVLGYDTHLFSVGGTRNPLGEVVAH